MLCKVIKCKYDKKEDVKIMIQLKEITSENFDHVLLLKVSESQKDFVSSPVYSLAQAYVYRETAYPFAIYADSTVVGFMMLGYYKVKNQYTLWKLLIDERFQNNGYGKESLKLGIHYLVNRFKVKEVFTGVAFGNDIAKNLYESFGFKETGNRDEFQLEMKLEILDKV